MSSCCTTQPEEAEKPEELKNTRSLSAYAPLFVMITVTALGAAADEAAQADWSWARWMHRFMGFTLLVFAMVKLFNLPAFAKGFAKYDLLAAKSRAYALAFPFLELALGLAYLSHWNPDLTYLATIVVLSFGTLGVVRTMLKGEAHSCACMGKILDVPVSTVTLTENLSMVAMAAVMWFS